ncbi:hypothetical protein PM082_017580 [Marasmius tenuissimus]|nr:hypothetical protein PM082_017580 [Marasmius tenuissimus]
MGFAIVEIQAQFSKLWFFKPQTFELVLSWSTASGTQVFSPSKANSLHPSWTKVASEDGMSPNRIFGRKFVFSVPVVLKLWNYAHRHSNTWFASLRPILNPADFS